ncbi:MAG: hypothetical protein H6834_08395 [Planctomycetes bacterium]|nr:hypothetical protein [Planctomycetota bacterium]
MLLVAHLAVRFTVEFFVDDPNAYETRAWPKLVAGCLAAASAFAWGRLWNRTSRAEGRPTHTFFFVPMEYWGALIPVILGLVTFSEMREHAEGERYLEAPRVNDVYLMDVTRLDERVPEGGPYGAFVIRAIEDETIVMAPSTRTYASLHDLRELCHREEVRAPGFFLEARVEFTRERLRELFDEGVILLVFR